MSKKKKQPKKNNHIPKKDIKKDIKENNKKSESFMPYYLTIAGIIFIIFGLIYGFKVLNPKKVVWILTSGNDLMQHYIGWEAFRYGKWTFPFGVTDTISYPLNISVIHTDAIPILAIFFKLISFMLPKTFQYLGLYGLTCFILQGIIAAKILRKYTDSKLNIIAGSILFAIIPSMIFRMFYHTALASQWLILLSLETIFLYDEFKEGKKIYYIWAIISFLIVNIHLYYILMCGIILLGYILIDILNTKKIKRSIILLAIYLLVALLSLWLLGGFMNMHGNDTFGFRLFSYNLNGLFNPQGWSIFLKDLAMIPEQYEGFSYLGLGVIILLIISFILTILWYRKDKTIIKEHKNILFSFILITILCTIAALSPTAYIGKHVIYDIKLPEVITNMWAIFRSSGRLIWPVIHIIMLSSIIIIVKRLNWKISAFLIIVCLFIQIIDIGNVLSEKHSFYANEYKINEKYDLYNFEYLKKLTNIKEVKTLVLASPQMYDSDKILYADWALNNGIKTNTMHFARAVFEQLLADNTIKLLEDIDNTKAYIFLTPDECHNHELICYKLPNDEYLGYINPLQ